MKQSKAVAQPVISLAPIVAWCLLAGSLGCRTAAPIHVWQPTPNSLPKGSSIAIATLSGQRELVQALENALVQQRPAVRSDLKVITSQQLGNADSPIRLVSTAPVQSDLTALQAARSTAASLLLEGEILNARLASQPTEVPPTPGTPPPNDYLLISWRLVEVSSGKTMANHIVSIDTHRADELYPDLVVTHADPTERLLAASARDSWKALAPSVERDSVELMIPWLQLGAIRSRMGVRYAKQGRWDLAEEQWRKATRFNPFNVAARHNLAIAQAAHEDFPEAKRQLRSVRWPMSTRLPPESSVWLDQRHRQYNAAHGLAKPAEGWLFPDPTPSELITQAEPTSIEELPLWTAIPLAKPPGWSWRAWLRQPIVW